MQNEITTEIIDVTPSIAAEWLERHNTDNRPVREPRVDALAKDMMDGNWMMNGETIKFTKEGKLLDGQHRLHAIKKSGRMIRLIVLRGLEDTSQATMDNGLKRSLADALRWREESNVSTLGSVLTGVISWEGGQRDLYARVGQRPITIPEALSYLDAHPEIRHLAQRAKQWSNTSPTTAKVLGVLYHAFSNINEEDAEDFMSKFTTDIGHKANDPIYVARKTLFEARLKRAKSRASGSTTQWESAIIIKAWNKYRNGEPANRLFWSPGGAKPEKFPEPI